LDTTRTSITFTVPCVFRLRCACSGIAGGVVSQPFFESQFGLVNPDGSINSKYNQVSSNVVSVLQAGAFFGALGSAPISSMQLYVIKQARELTKPSHPLSDRLGRRWALMVLVVILSVGAVSVSDIYLYLSGNSGPQIFATMARGSQGINYIYAGRIVSGFGIGGISTISPAYVSECSPKGVRGRITGVLTVMIAIGAMLSYFVNRKWVLFLITQFMSCSVYS